MRKLVFICCFLSIYFNCKSQDSETNAIKTASNYPDIFISENPVMNFPGIKKILLPGLSRSQFLDACAIQWIPIQKEDSVWRVLEVNLKNFLKYDEIELLIEKLNISEILKVYKSTLLSEDGRTIYSLEIGKGEQRIVFTAGVHAREVANTHFLLKFAAELVNNYEQKDQGALELLNKFRIIVLPCINPDGYSAAIEGNSSIKNKNLFLAKQENEKIYTAKSNANGVDINRNFPSYSSSLLWDDEELHNAFSINEPALNYFAGYSLGSENETQVAMNFLMRNIPYAYRFVDFHSAGRLVYAGKPHLSDEFNTLCGFTGKIISGYTHYSLLGLKQEESGNGADGTITDFAAEIAAGFIFNDKLGRLAPANSDSLVRKTEDFRYRCSVNTIETLKTSRKDGYGLIRTSTPEMHVKEWEKYRLNDLFIKIIEE